MASRRQTLWVRPRGIHTHSVDTPGHSETHARIPGTDTTRGPAHSPTVTPPVTPFVAEALASGPSVTSKLQVEIEETRKAFDEDEKLREAEARHDVVRGRRKGAGQRRSSVPVSCGATEGATAGARPLMRRSMTMQESPLASEMNMDDATDRSARLRSSIGAALAFIDWPTPQRCPPGPKQA